jgi:radical SAM superfamily enzyme YgiQ (UPF0313 family)
MRILFIYAADLKEGPYNYLHHKMTPGEFYLPKMGILYLAAALRREFPGFGYKAVDILNPAHREMHADDLEAGMVHTLGAEELYEEVAGFSPNIVGLSCLTANAVYLPKIIKIIKEANKDSMIILGGPYATSSRQQAVLTAGVDFTVYGEGETTLCSLVRAMVKGESIQRVKGIGFSENGAPVFTPPQPFIEDLDSLPFPAWDLCNLENYSKVHRFLGSGVQHSDNTAYANIVGSRGCPYKCAYCHNIFGSQFRARSPQNIIEEMLYLHEAFNVEEFTFSDDVFNLDRARLKEFCRLLIKANRPVKFGFITNGLRGDILSEEIIDLLYEAGMRGTSIAVESASSRIQKMICKHLNLPKVRRSIEYMCKKGIYVITFNMIGFPTETKEEIKQTLEFNTGLPHHALVVFTVTPHMGTELYKMITEEDSQAHTPGDKSGMHYWQPDEKDDSFRQVSSLFLQIMMVRFITNFHFSPERIQANLEIMTLNKNNPFFIDSIKRFYRINWELYSNAVPASKREKIDVLVNGILSF